MAVVAAQANSAVKIELAQIAVVARVRALAVMEVAARVRVVGVRAMGVAAVAKVVVSRAAVRATAVADDGCAAGEGDVDLRRRVSIPRLLG